MAEIGFFLCFHTENNIGKNTVEYYKQEFYRGEYIDVQILQTISRGIAHQHLTYEFIVENYIDGVENVEGYRESDFIGVKFSHFIATSKGELVDVNAVLISGDGSTVIQIFYALKLISVTIEYDINRVTDVVGAGEYAYGARVPLAMTIKNGYDFVEWRITKNGETTTSASKEYTLVIDVDTDIVVEIVTECGQSTYKVLHYFEELGQTEYGEPRKTEIKTGTTESQIDIESLILDSEEGYVYDFFSCTDPAYKIYGDSETIVSLYYALRLVTFKISYQEGISSVTVEAADEISQITLISADVDNKTMTYVSKYTATILLSVELEKGYDFLGWSLDSGRVIAGSDEKTGYQYIVRADDFTLDASAYRKLIAIRYNPNNGTNITIDDPAEYGEEITLRQNPNPYKNGNRIFLGWATEQDGEVVYQPGEIIIVDFEENLMLYAVWGEPAASNMWMYIAAGAGGALLLGFLIFFILKRRKKRKEDEVQNA